MRVATISPLLQKYGSWGSRSARGGTEGQGETLPGGAARPGLLAPRNFGPRSGDDRYPHRGRHPQHQHTPPTPPPRPGAGSCRRFGIFGSALAADSGRRLTEGAALAQLRPQFIVPSQGRGRRPIPCRGIGAARADARDSEPPAPHPDTETLAPLPEKLGAARALPSPGSPHLSLPPQDTGSARSRGTPALRGAAALAANTYPESFPIFTKLNTSIHAAG